METIDIVKSVLDLGITGLLLYFLLTVWKDKKETEKLKDETIAKKDQILLDNRNQILEVVKENTKTQSELRSSIQENTKATETLTNRIYELLGKH